ncbi:MAG TPA: SDR family NAD(P)-dependent oxidoreductase, partial [Fimbriimonadaceae bacterium]|nr:SDR family NAD(P)-dependent oxidoreductase [Fimbriimonadaceae bacterium]
PAVSVVAGDVCDQDAASKVADTLEHMQGERVLINCAGCAQFGDFAEADIDREIAMVDVMLSGTMRMTRAILPQMLDQGAGTVVNVLSVSSTTVFAGAAGYCSAKAGALMFTRVLAKEVRSRGVRVIAVIPGATDTGIWDGMESHPPREDMLTPGAIAEVIRDAINAPRDRNLDEIAVMPPKGIL